MALKKQREVIINNEPVFWQMSMQELEFYLGSWEQEYKEHETGKLIHNEVLGYLPEGIIKWAEELEVIKNNAVLLPAYSDWIRKYQAHKELELKREYYNFKNMTPEEKEEYELRRHKKLRNMKERLSGKLDIDIKPCITCGKKHCNCDVKDIESIPF